MKFLWAPWRLKFLLQQGTFSTCPFCVLPKEPQDKANLILHRGVHCFSILNKYPYNTGHLMVVPYQHTSNLASLSNDELLEIQQCIRRNVQALTEAMKPEGFNVGMNLGLSGGAGIQDHLHYHVVPRWNGDTNFMPVLAQIKVLPELLEETYDRLRPFLHA